MFGRIDKSDEIGMIFLSLEGSKIFEVKVFLKDDSVIILIHINVEGILSFYLSRNRVHSVFIFVGISIESDLLSDCDTDSEVFCG